MKKIILVVGISAALLSACHKTAEVAAVNGSGPAKQEATVNIPPKEITPSEPAENPASNQTIKPIYFDFDKDTLRDQSVRTLMDMAGWLVSNKSASVLIEGNCDERGSAAYNYDLGDRRARSAKSYLVSLGVAPEHIRIKSNGKDNLACVSFFDNDNECHQMNRRDEFTIIMN